MTSIISPTSASDIKVHDDTLVSPETKFDPKSIDTALRLPDVSELLTHLKLIDAIIFLKNAIEAQGQAYGVEPGKAWNQFCRAAAVKFLKWSDSVDASKKTIPIPPLDVLMIWHSYMLNTKDYVYFQNKARRGQLAGKSFDWQGLERKLELDHGGVSDILDSWDPSDKTHTPKLESLSPVDEFDMVAAVQRQLKFAEKMHDAQWRHPDKVNSFLSSAIGQYKEFFSLIAENPGVGLAPTLAIDLVWHTHQLSPRRYRTYCRHMTNGRFVHHDDNLDGPTLEEASHNAEKLYFAKYGVPYKRSMCFAKQPMCFGKQDIFCIVCFAPRDAKGQQGPTAEAGAGPEAAVRQHPAGSSCSSVCSSVCGSGGCSTGCRAGCRSYCRGGLCRDQCRAACGYVCGACETKDSSSD